MRLNTCTCTCRPTTKYSVTGRYTSVVRNKLGRCRDRPVSRACIVDVQSIASNIAAKFAIRPVLALLIIHFCSQEPDVPNALIGYVWTDNVETFSGCLNIAHPDIANESNHYMWLLAFFLHTNNFW